VCGQLHIREALAGVEQPFLPVRIARSRVGVTKLHVVEILSRDGGSRVITHGEPYLSAMAGIQIVRRPAPPILVATQPGSRALERTFGQRRAIAKARSTSCSLVSE
jgi:hypothetical protein